MSPEEHVLDKEDTVKFLQQQLAATQQKLVEAEARVWRQEQMLRAFRYSIDTENPFPSLDKLNELLSESPSDALRAYEQERFRERTEGLMEILNEILMARTNHGDMAGLKSENLARQALTTLKKERGE